MAKDNESTMKWKIDIADLKASMNDAKRSISLANAEFKAATSGMDQWSKSTTGLEAKLKQLNSTLPQQKTILEQLEKQYQLVAQNQGENSAEAQKLLIQIENQKAAIGKTEASIAKYNQQLVDMQKQEASANSALGSLTKTIDDQEKAVADLKTQYANAVLQYGKNSKEAKDLAKQIDDLSGELADNKKNLSDAQKAADQFDNSLSDANKTAKESDSGFTVLKGTLANLVTQGINLVIDGLKDLAKTAKDAWKEFDSGSDIIIKKTGATGQAAKDLETVYKNVSKQVVGSFDELGSAVGEVNTRFDVTGDELEDLTIKFIKFAQLNGTDVSNSVDKVQGALAAWGLTADDASAMLDVLNSASQQTGASVDSITDALKTNAPALMEMGFSASDAAMFIANLDKNGADASATLGGMKKALAAAAKQGKPMNQAMKDMEKSIKNAKSTTEAITIASELFGSKAGASIATAVRSGKLSFEQLGTTMKDFEGNVVNTFDATLDPADKFALAMQGIRTDMAEAVGNLLDKYAPEIEDAIATMKDIISGFFDIVEAGIDWFIENGDTVVSIIKAIAMGVAAYVAYTTAVKVMTEGWKALTIVTKAQTTAQAALNAVMNANPIGLVIAAITALVAAFVLLWNKSEAFREFWYNLWEGIKETCSKVIDAIVGFFKNAWTRIKESWSKVKSFFTGIWDGIKDVFSGITDWFKDKFTDAWEGIKNVFSKVGDFFGGIWDTIKEKFTNIGQKIGEVTSDAFKSAINALLSTAEKVLNAPIRAINKLLGVINKIPSVNIGKLDTFSLPRLEQGGILKKGQIGLLEGNGSEAVIPLDQNRKWISSVVREMVNQMSGSGSGAVLVGGKSEKMTQNVTFNQTINSPEPVDRLSVYRDTNNLLFSAKVRLGNV